MVQNPAEKETPAVTPEQPGQPSAAQREPAASVPGANPAQPMQSQPGAQPAGPAAPAGRPAEPAKLETAEATPA